MNDLPLETTKIKKTSLLENPLKAGLSRQFLLLFLGIIIAIYSVIYLFSVPLIEQKVFEIERNASKIALNNVFEIANRMKVNLEQSRTQALDSHKKQLHIAVSFAGSFIRNELKEAANKNIPLDQAKQDALLKLSALTYGDEGYMWVADFDGQVLSHPLPELIGTHPKDEEGALILDPILIEKTLREGEGYFEYKWTKASNTREQDKVSYVRKFPEWGLMIGTGLYLEDLEEELIKRKNIALEELANSFKDIKIAETGYFYLFDSTKKLLIHPNSNVEGTIADELINPKSEGFIMDELIGVAHSGEELEYLWDRPDDPGNYVYEKLSLVRYLPSFDWYIGSSVYLDELRSSSKILSKRLLTLAALTIFCSIFLVLFFVKRVTKPLEQLANTALKVRHGDYTAKSGINSDDEVGIMAKSFDGMVEKLKNNIDTLDIQVKNRTDELLQTNAQAQRMNAVGQLAGGLAHDFNNLLSIILGNLLLARDRFKSNTELDHFITPAIRASRRGADITHRLLSFSRKQPLQPTIVLLDQLLNETTKLISRSLPDRISLKYSTESKSLKVFVDPSNLENTLINLAFNAKDAIPDNGTLTFKTSLINSHSAERTIESGYDEDVPSGTYIKITVKDTGKGFSEEALKKAYEPFYTTKSEYDNSGLGLSMIYGFVKQSKGYIRIISTIGEGSCISILLPTITKEIEKKTVNYNNSQSLSHKGKLFLLVEDNDDVRNVVCEQLVQLGIKVIECKSMEEATQLIQNIDSLDGMLTDYMLKGKKEGQKLAELLYSKNKNSVILLMSGYSYEPDNNRGKELLFPLLQKPFDNNDLTNGISLAVKKVKYEKSNFEY